MYTTTGFIKKLNKGTIQIPQQFIEELNFSPNEEVKLYLDGDSIIIEPVKHKCVFCNSETTEKFYNKPICPDCIASVGLK